MVTVSDGTGVVAGGLLAAVDSEFGADLISGGRATVIVCVGGGSVGWLCGVGVGFKRFVAGSVFAVVVSLGIFVAGGAAISAGAALATTFVGGKVLAVVGEGGGVAAWANSRSRLSAVAFTDSQFAGLGVSAR